jgi:hypothetical protein
MWKKCCRTGQATDDNMARAHCMLDTLGYRHTLRICNTYCFFTATTVAQTRLNVTLYVFCSSFLYILALKFKFEWLHDLYLFKKDLLYDNGEIHVIKSNWPHNWRWPAMISYRNSYTKRNKMQRCIKILFHIYIKLNMFRPTHRPSSGA